MTAVTIVGNLASDPEVRYTASGQAVANFTVCHTPRFFDRASGEFKDGETLFLRGSIWKDYAEHVAESLHRGDQVIVTGRLKQRSWTVEGTDEKRTVIELDAEDIGPALRFATVKVSRVRSQGAAPSESFGEPGTPLRAAG